MHYKVIKRTFLLSLICLPVFALADAGNPPKDESIIVKNKVASISFNTATGALESFSDLRNSVQMIDKLKTSSSSPWEIAVDKGSTSRKLDVSDARAFRYYRSDNKHITLVWSDFANLSNPKLKVTVDVMLDDSTAFSKWHIAVSGIKGEKLRRVTFPKLNGLKRRGTEQLAVPIWMGALIENPRGGPAETRHYSWNYPGPLSMQFLALANSESDGLYVACDDTMNYSKQFEFRTDSMHHFGYQMNNFPSYDDTLSGYNLPYNATIGFFKGDWLSAAMIYREWGTKQRWCRESRFKNDLKNSWVAGTALWEWNRGKSNNVLSPAVSLKKRLDLPVSVLWHWWHASPYDDGFPEYFPPKEGAASFKDALANADKEGVKAIVYMNSFQWGTSTQSYTKEDASRWAVKDINGNTAAHVFNIFTHHSLTPMCIATPFWKNKYAALADKAINEFHTGGIYMDQACLHFKCYDESHGHAIGGGNYWVKNFGILTHQIRSANTTHDNITLAGEGCGEGWLPFLDAMLTLQVSKERYAGIDGTETIPLFQAVYHQYGITFGSYSSLVSPPYDESWPQKDAPKNPEQLLSPAFNEQFLMEQARSFVWGMQPTIANYHDSLSVKRKEEIDYLLDLAKIRYHALNFLLYGKFIRLPNIQIPTKEINISRLSVYAGQKDRVTSFKEKVPTVYCSAWKADNDAVGIALAGIDHRETPIQFNVQAAQYGLPRSGRVYLINSAGRKLLQTYKNGDINIHYMLPPLGICVLEISADT